MDLAEWAGPIGLLLGIAVTKTFEVFSQRRIDRRRKAEAVVAEQERQRQKLEELDGRLRRTGQLFTDQAAVRDRLKEDLSQTHPDFKPRSPGYEYLFSELYDEMNPRQRTLHAMIVGYTEDRLVPANRGVLQWLEDYVEFRSPSQPTAERTGLAGELDLLERHLNGWFVKYHRVFSRDTTRAVVYLGDEEGLGLGFPPNLEPALGKVLAQGAASDG